MTDTPTADDRDSSGREAILEAARFAPWATHAQLADELETARSWVSEVLGDAPTVDAIRDAFRKGVEIEPDEADLHNLATLLERTDDVDDEVAQRVRESSSIGDVASVRIEFEEKETDEQEIDS